MQKKPNFPPPWVLKAQARQLMGKHRGGYIRAAVILVGVEMLCYVARFTFGGMLGYYAMKLSDYPAAQTGLSLSGNGISGILRLDAMDTVLALPLSFRELEIFLLVNLVVFAVLAPMRMAVLEQYWGLYREDPKPISRLFTWYLDARLLVKSIVVEGLLDLIFLVADLLCMIPSLALFLWAATENADSAAVAAASVGSSLLAVLGMAAAYFFYTLLFPARYVLTADPSKPVGQVLREGFQSLKGYRGSFFWFRLSFLLWLILSEVTQGLTDIFVHPYTSLASILFLEEAQGKLQRSETDSSLDGSNGADAEKPFQGDRDPWETRRPNGEKDPWEGS